MHSHSGKTGNCDNCYDCPWEGLNASPVRGWRFVGMAALYFLLPVILAIAGAWLLGTTHAGQFVGGVIGLGAGMAFAALAGKFGGNARNA